MFYAGDLKSAEADLTRDSVHVIRDGHELT